MAPPPWQAPVPSALLAYGAQPIAASDTIIVESLTPDIRTRRFDLAA